MYTWNKIGQNIVWKNNVVKLLADTIDNNLKFDNYVTNMCLKANKKLNALFITSAKISLWNEIEILNGLTRGNYLKFK